MKYYNQKDLTMVFGIIVIGYFSLRYLMTRKLMEGQSNNEECRVNYHVEDGKCVKCPKGTYRNAGDKASGNDTTCKQCGRDPPEWSNCKGSNNNR